MEQRLGGVFVFCQCLKALFAHALENEFLHLGNVSPSPFANRN